MILSYEELLEIKEYLELLLELQNELDMTYNENKSRGTE